MNKGNGKGQDDPQLHASSHNDSQPIVNLLTHKAQPLSRAVVEWAESGEVMGDKCAPLVYLIIVQRLDFS